MKNPELSGKVVVKFVISATGSVASATVTESTLDEPSVETCIVNKVKRWVFPEPAGGGIVVVNYPFIFSS